MQIYVTNIFVEDQEIALDFYTNKLGFVLKHDVPLGTHRWLTVTGKDNPDGTELLLEPNHHPAASAYQKALMKDGIPAASFKVDDLQAEYDRLIGLGVTFTSAPVEAGQVKMVILNDGCGNLVQLIEMTS